MVAFTYLVSKDLALTLERRLGYKLNEGQKVAIDALEDRFLQEFWAYVPANIIKESVSADALSKLLQYLLSQENLPVVTLDDVYVNPSKVNGFFSVTRLTDPKTYETKIGSRPGAPSLEEQISKLASKYKGKEIALADVGAFEGNTLVDVISMLEKASIKIPKVYLGVWGTQAINKVNGAVKQTVALRTYDLFEWIELRDFFGIDGRKTESGKIIPYWENLEKWASIVPENVQQVRELCQKYNGLLNDILGGAK